MDHDRFCSIKRRSLYSMIGAAAGNSVMFDAVTAAGFAAEVRARPAGPVRRQGDAKDTALALLCSGRSDRAAARDRMKRRSP